MRLLASMRPWSISSCNLPSVSSSRGSCKSFRLKPNLGRRRYSGVWPPSNPSRTLPPERARRPLCPRPEVLPFPVPGPRPRGRDCGRGGKREAFQQEGRVSGPARARGRGARRQPWRPLLKTAARERPPPASSLAAAGAAARDRAPDSGRLVCCGTPIAHVGLGSRVVTQLVQARRGARGGGHCPPPYGMGARRHGRGAACPCRQHRSLSVCLCRKGSGGRVCPARRGGGGAEAGGCAAGVICLRAAEPICAASRRNARADPSSSSCTFPARWSFPWAYARVPPGCELQRPWVGALGVWALRLNGELPRTQPDATAKHGSCCPRPQQQSVAGSHSESSAARGV